MSGLRAILLMLWAALLVLAAPALAQEKRIALTFDDVPRGAGAFFTPEERTRRLIAALEQAGVEQAAFFVTTGNLAHPDGAGGEARIAAYVAAGHVIANHSDTHLHLDATPAEDYLADLDRAAAWLNGRPGFRPWFRFPFLDEGGRDAGRRDALRAGLAARALRNGYATADGSDWHLEQLTLDAKRAGKPMDMAALRKLYLQSQLSGIAYHEALARRTLGRLPPQVMLLHETDLAALFIADLVAELRKDGWTIITADQAYADAELAAAMPIVPHTSGTLTGMMAWERGVQPPLAPLWMSTAMMSWLFETRVLAAPGEDGQ
ncbi:polysaccharide deacetylase family protein [Erythrobacter sp. BLCC-B19]|uniref:polysaccharide deacetylase family protein n=1 Tax=Erythrobacter sp. BLCC-B19 TaxID=3025315 RepID=UPI0023605825|nr:polysaccharide deacetylase family protein [Erythrobacter sp. BLCC-B19]WDA42808.1 polysaccharide deacetylase family protein [Erythrobacter sp. BLCC-B19]